MIVFAPNLPTFEPFLEAAGAYNLANMSKFDQVKLAK